MARLKLFNKNTIFCFIVAVALYVIVENLKLIYFRSFDHQDYENLQNNLFQTVIKNLERRRNAILYEKKSQKLEIIYKHLNATRNTKSFPASKIGTYHLLSPDVCSNSTLVDIIIIVHTAPEHMERRHNIRQTFGNASLFVPFEVRVVFLLGKPRYGAVMPELKSEHERYADMVMGDFVDDYHNLTLKGVMGFHWVSQFCPNSRYVLKIDDDVIVDTYKLLTKYMPHMDGKKKTFFCNVWRKNMRIERNGKWAVPSQIFPDMQTFPYYYCSGFTVLMTSDLVGPLYIAAHVTPFFWIDDVFLFGILPFFVGDVAFHDYQIGKNISLNQDESMKCLDKMGLDCNYFSTLLRRDSYDETYFPMWRKIQSLHDHNSWKPVTFFEP